MEFHRSQVTMLIDSKANDPIVVIVIHTPKKNMYFFFVFVETNQPNKIKHTDLVKRKIVNACRRSLRINSRQIKLNEKKKKHMYSSRENIETANK